MGWQVFGTLPDSMEGGWGVLWPVPLSLSLLGLTVGQWCAHLEHPHQVHPGHTPRLSGGLRCLPLTEERSNFPFSVSFSVTGVDTLGALWAFIVRTLLSLPPCGSANLNSVGESALLGLMCTTSACLVGMPGRSLKNWGRERTLSFLASQPSQLTT